MDISPKHKKAMSKDEASLLIDLIQSNPILTSKETNAATNKTKEDTWIALVSSFNAKSGSIPRTKEQLKFKWDNLKKAARKRTQQIRMNNLKTGGGKIDETLDRVSSLLGSTGTGYEVPFGGDRVGSTSLVLNDTELNFGGCSDAGVNDARPNVLDDVEILKETTINGTPNRKRKLSDSAMSSPTADSSKYFFGKPIPKTLKIAKKGKNKENGATIRNLAIAKYYEKETEKLELENGATIRNLAIARYYEKKTEKLELEIKILKLELEKKDKLIRNCEDSGLNSDK